MMIMVALIASVTLMAGIGIGRATAPPPSVSHRGPSARMISSRWLSDGAIGVRVMHAMNHLDR
jgi:hypothetical protein